MILLIHGEIVGRAPAQREVLSLIGVAWVLYLLAAIDLVVALLCRL